MFVYTIQPVVKPVVKPVVNASPSLREVVQKLLYKCNTEGLMHVTAWYHWNPGPKFTRFGE